MSQVKEMHWNPQFHLRNFNKDHANKKDNRARYVSQWNIDEKKYIAISSIANQAKKKKFYEQKLESEFAKLESKVALTINRIITSKKSPIFKKELYKFISYQYARTKVHFELKKLIVTDAESYW